MRWLLAWRPVFKLGVQLAYKRSWQWKATYWCTKSSSWSQEENGSGQFEEQTNLWPVHLKSGDYLVIWPRCLLFYMKPMFLFHIKSPKYMSLQHSKHQPSPIMCQNRDQHILKHQNIQTPSHLSAYEIWIEYQARYFNTTYSLKPAWKNEFSKFKHKLTVMR